MKKILSIIAVAGVITLTSCGGGGGFESDVRKMAEMGCKAQKLAATATDPTKAKELADLQKEAEELGKKFEEKYKDKKGDKVMEEKATKIMAEVMANCK
jgi:hypothetical protein